MGEEIKPATTLKVTVIEKKHTEGGECGLHLALDHPGENPIARTILPKQ